MSDLNVWSPGDKLRITFGPKNQPIEQGSPGQKTAALLAFILSYGSEPLLLDQPEDDLDNFVQIHNQVSARKDIGRIEQPQYSMGAIFEALVNAVVHRDYSRTASKIRLFMFADRLELSSPGALANTLTVERLRYGQATRNELLARLLSEISVEDNVGRQIARRYFLKRRGEGVGIILDESADLSGKVPVYEQIDETLHLNHRRRKVPARRAGTVTPRLAILTVSYHSVLSDIENFQTTSFQQPHTYAEVH